MPYILRFASSMAIIGHASDVPVSRNILGALVSWSPCDIQVSSPVLLFPPPPPARGGVSPTFSEKCGTEWWELEVKIKDGVVRTPLNNRDDEESCTSARPYSRLFPALTSPPSWC